MNIDVVLLKTSQTSIPKLPHARTGKPQHSHSSGQKKWHEWLLCAMAMTCILAAATFAIKNGFGISARNTIA